MDVNSIQYTYVYTNKEEHFMYTLYIEYSKQQQ